jgi:hypothetical protein
MGHTETIMRTLWILLACVLCALPLAAQTTRAYKPPAATELEQLRKDSKPGLREIRGGKSTTGCGLSEDELRTLDELAKDNPEAQEILRDLRAGRVRVHVDGWWDGWAWAVLVPCSCASAALVVLLLLLLIW